MPTLSHTQLDAVVEVMRRAGDYQLTQFRRFPPGGGSAKTGKELVSHVDVRSEHMLRDGLRRILPAAGFFGEETGRAGNRDLLWVVDPLDGTSNFLSGLDVFAISVALVATGVPVAGAVLKPASGELFTGRRGAGAHRNGRLLPAVGEMDISATLIGTGFPYRSPDLLDPFFCCARDVLAASRGIRRMGSAALDLSSLAAGELQGFWEADLQPYDVAAALVFMRETGCAAVTHGGTPYDLFHHRLLVAGLPGVCQALSDIVDRHYPASSAER